VGVVSGRVLQSVSFLCCILTKITSFIEYLIDIIGAMVIVWRVRGKIFRSVLCNIVHNNCAQCNAHTYEWT